VCGGGFIATGLTKQTLKNNNLYLRLRVNEVDAVLVDGDEEDLWVIGFCRLLDLEEGGAERRPLEDDLQEVDLGVFMTHTRVTVEYSHDSLRKKNKQQQNYSFINETKKKIFKKNVCFTKRDNKIIHLKKQGVHFVNLVAVRGAFQS
jgi:hypothetical protein